MESTLRIERIFSLGDYNNIKFSQEITQIPEHLLKNEKVVGLLYSLMILEVEKAHKDYILLYKSYTEKQIEETIAAIEAARTKTFMELIEEIDKTLDTKE